MAKIRTLEKEVTLLAEANGHGLFLWHRQLSRGTDLPKTQTLCALCGEKISLVGWERKAPDVSGVPNQHCHGKAVS